MFVTLIGVFSVMWSELMMTSAISERVPESGVCVHISVRYVCDVLYAVFYVRGSCFVVCGCAFSGMYRDVCNCDVFSVVNVYLDHFKFCVVCINGRRYVCYSECNVVSNECLVRTVVRLCTIGVFALGVSLVS